MMPVVRDCDISEEAKRLGLDRRCKYDFSDDGPGPKAKEGIAGPVVFLALTSWVWIPVLSLLGHFLKLLVA